MHLLVGVFLIHILSPLSFLKRHITKMMKIMPKSKEVAITDNPKAITMVLALSEIRIYDNKRAAVVVG